MTPAALAQFRTRLPECELAVYVDIGAGTVLAADGALSYPQEYLDALCKTAAMVFSVGAPGPQQVPLDRAVFSTPTGKRAFVRRPDRGPEVLCCICAPDADMPDVLDLARQALGGDGQGAV